MSTEHQSKKEYDEANRNIAEFLDALEHGECETGEKTLSDKKELPAEQSNSNQALAESGTSILQMNPPSGWLSPLQVVQASQTIGPYIDPIVLCMHSHATEAILRPDDGSCQVPKSDLEHNNRPAVLPVQRVQHLRDLISEDAKMCGTIHLYSHPPISSTKLHSKECANPQLLQVERTKLLGSRNGELDGSSSSSKQRDCPLPMNVDSSVLVQEQPELVEFRRWTDEVTAESATDGSPLSRDVLVPANPVKQSQERVEHYISSFDLNQFPPSSPQRRPIPIPNSLYDPRYQAIGLPTDPILRMFVLSRGFYAP